MLYKQLVQFMIFLSSRRTLAMMAFCCAASSPVLAQHAAMTTKGLTELFDEHVVREMKNGDVPGAAIVVVNHGKVLFARGYGYADVGQKIPVSPTTTLFRIASVSKVVTYTAVMQLVEQGKIDLDADIARYLDFHIPADFGKPITMRHLMSHTAGFEETVQGRWVQPGKLTSLRDYLEQHMPKRLFAPGTVPAYSSYGTTLAAYIVERVSGYAFVAYVEKHVFAPLGMRHSSFEQPLPEHLAPILAKGYATAKGPAGSFDIAQVAPAASMSSSAVDMAHFMLAHLGVEPASGVPLLKPETLATMHAVQFRHHPAAPGIALGVYEMEESALRMIGHTGDIPGFRSAMYLFPEQGTGLLIVQNADAGEAMRKRLVKVFAETYLTAPARMAAVTADIPADESANLAGSYRTSWRFDSSPLSLKFLLEQRVVRMLSPATLVIDTQVGSDGKPVEWHRIDAGVWQSATDPVRRLYFSRNKEGGWEQGDWEMSSNGNPTYIMQKSAWHQHKLLLLIVLPSSLLLVLLSLSWQALSALFRRRDARSRVLSPPSLRVSTVVRVVGLLTLAPWVVYGAIALLVMNDLLFVASPACGILLRLVQIFAWLAAAGGIAVIVAASASLHSPDTHWTSRVHHVALAVACVAATAMAWQGGLLFWNGRF
ncbi:MAG: serine hydrolase domain-containing protein [Duganella sp.]